LIRLLLRQIFLGVTSGIPYEFLCCAMHYYFLLFFFIFQILHLLRKNLCLQIEVIPLKAISFFACGCCIRRVLDEYFTFTVCSSTAMFPDRDFFVDLIENIKSEVCYSSSVIGLSITTIETANLPVKSFRWSRKRV